MKIIKVMALSATLLFANLALAASPPATELFGCNFLDGKDMDDLQKVIDFYAKNRSKIGSAELMKMGSNVWTPFRGSPRFDLVWANTGLTLEEWGRATQAYDNSKEGQDTDARFNEVIDCPTSGVVLDEVLHDGRDGLQPLDGNELIIETYACTFNPGKSMADVDGAIAAWKAPFARAVQGGSVVMRRVPMMQGQYDVMYAGVWNNLSEFAAATSALAQDPEAAASGALFIAAHRCESGLWKLRRVVAPE